MSHNARIRVTSKNAEPPRGRRPKRHLEASENTDFPSCHGMFSLLLLNVSLKANAPLVFFGAVMCAGTAVALDGPRTCNRTTSTDTFDQHVRCYSYSTRICLQTRCCCCCCCCCCCYCSVDVYDVFSFWMLYLKPVGVSFLVSGLQKGAAL